MKKKKNTNRKKIKNKKIIFLIIKGVYSILFIVFLLKIKRNQEIMRN